MQKTYLFIVDANQYSGDFETLLAAHLTSYYDSDMNSDAKPFASQNALPPQIKESITQKKTWVRGEDDNDVFFEIYTTPGRVNYRGCHVDETTFKERCDTKNYSHAYESVGVYFHQALTEEEISYLKSQAHSFATQAEALGFPEFKDVKIINFRLKEISIEKTTIDLAV